MTAQHRRKRHNRYSNTQIYDCSLSRIGTGSSIKYGGDKLVLRPKNSHFSFIYCSHQQFFFIGTRVNSPRHIYPMSTLAIQLRAFGLLDPKDLLNYLVF